MTFLQTLRRFRRQHVFLSTTFTVLVGLAGTTPPAFTADILRGGTARPGANPSAGSPGGISGTPANVDANRAAAQDILRRTHLSLEAVRQLQEAARQAALNGPNHLGMDPNHPGQMLPDVPNGLGVGGLEVDPGVATNPGLWTGANLPTQNQNAGRTNVTVVQTAQQALLNWKTFNIGKETTLKFDQSAGGTNRSQWVAFNKINDPSGRPSQILGRIEAEGQVYVINQNGIIFGGSSQVNTHALVASALPINDNLIQRGLLNNPDAQFLFSALALPAGTKGPTPGFTPPTAPAGGKYGDVTVQAGARIEAPTSAASVGGRVVLVGANVTNKGTISTPDGQTILAAGLQVGFVAHSSSDPSLRGLDTFVGAVVDPLSVVPAYAGTVKNEGLIDSPRASITLTGKTVEQNNVINSSTSVALNGRVDLLASYGASTNTTYDPVLFPNAAPFLYKNTGTVKLGENSITQILPEWASTEKVIGTELALRSQVNINGRSIYFGKGSTLLAPNAKVKVDAGLWDYVGGAIPQSYFVHNGGQIYLDSDATINVAGSTDISVPVSQNFITLDLRAAELADSPLQRFGALRGQTITVDIRNKGIYNGKAWVGTPLADLSGYANIIQRGVGELTIAGGSVDLNAGGSVVMQTGSEVNVSAGWINYTGATVRTTKLVSNGHIYDIADATPNLVYSGVYTGTTNQTSLKWASRDVFGNPITPKGVYDASGYVSGGNGGSIKITSAATALDGSFTGRTISGPNQRVAGPKLSEFTLRFEAEEMLTSIYPVYSPTPPTVTFQSGVTQTAANAYSVDANGNPAALRADRLANVFLSPELLRQAGFGKLTVANNDGRIIVPVGTTMQAAVHGSITLSAANMDILGTLSAPGGSIDLKVFNISPSVALAIQRDPLPVEPLPATGRGLFTLGASAKITTAGTLTDDRLYIGSPQRLDYALSGGDIHISAYSANLLQGSVLDVSGGVLVGANNQIQYGDAGGLHLKTGQDPVLGYVTGGKLQLGSTLLGYSGGQHGGTLSIQSALVQVGGTALHADTLLLQPEFFTQGGFSDYKISGLGRATTTPGEFLPGVFIAPGTVIAPVADSLVVSNSTNLETRIVRAPEGVRPVANIEFAAPGVNGIEGLKIRGEVITGAGSMIRTDAYGHVSLKGHAVAVLGSIETPGGHIEIKGADDSFALLYGDQTQALTTVYIGSQSVLSTAGKRLLLPDPYGRRVGAVLAGGLVSLSGNIAAASGSVIDVSGASGILDLHPTQASPNSLFQTPNNAVASGQLYGLATQPVQVDSNGGAIVLAGAQMLASDATLRGAAGGTTATGGTLTVSSGRFYLPDVIPPVLDTNLVVRQSGNTLAPTFADDASALGNALQGADGSPLIGRGYFSADKFASSGLDSLTLGGVVEFSGATTLTARGYLHVADGGVLFANSDVHLTAPSVVLGTHFQAPVRPENQLAQLPFTNVAPTHGTGRLWVNSKHLEIGTLTLQNIGSATLTADQGDIIGSGIFTLAGHLTLRAGQIYTPSASAFTTVAYDYLQGGATQAGSITIEGSGKRSLPLSAGGTLSFYASDIAQNGVLVSPIGTINLGWDGTGTAPRELLTGNTLPFPVTRNLTLGAGSITSVSAVDPYTGKGIVIPYGVSLDGNTWIDPRGVDITTGGLPKKIINIAGANVTQAQGAVVDLRGGGDLFAYRWVQGNGGSADILEKSGSYAILPDYASNHAPYGAYNSLNTSTNLIRAAGAGYVSEGLQVGDRIYLAGSKNLAAGFYTLLPARYALLPGGVLVTAKSQAAIGTQELPGNVSLVSGYTFNDLNGTRTLPTLASRFEVIGQGVINARSEFQKFSANTFLKQRAEALNVAVPELPKDSGYLLFRASQAMNLGGDVFTKALTGANGAVVGRGARVDISSPLAFSIKGSGATGTAGVIELNAATLSNWGAESLLIGGRRTSTGVEVDSTSITVDNAGSALTGPDIILASKGAISLLANSEIRSTGSLNGTAETMNITGNGSLVRVSQSQTAEVLRTGTTASSGPSLSIANGARLTGGSLTLDTTAVASLDVGALLSADAYNISSGRVSVVLDPGATLQPGAGLVLGGTVLANLQTAKSLRILSYTSLDVYGTGQVGQATTKSLTLSAGEIRGFGLNGGNVNFAAQQIILDNRSNGSVVNVGPAITNGTLNFNADSIVLGAGSLRVSQFSNVFLNGDGGILARGTGGFSSQGNLTVNASVITGEKAASHGLYADGALVTQAGGAGPDKVTGGLGASLTLQGSTVTSSTRLVAGSGLLSLHATSGDVIINGRLDAGGTAQKFYDVTRYTDAGGIRLSSAHGDVVVNAAAIVNVAAQVGGGHAGSLTVEAAEGAFVNQGSLLGNGGTGGNHGSFILDVGSLSSTAVLNARLNTAGFSFLRDFRVRSGDVLLEGLAQARNFRFSADQGSVTVTGTVDAAGTTGGQIQLIAHGDLTLASGSRLTVAGQKFDNAGKGGSITLEAGASRFGTAGEGSVDIQTGSTLNLSVAAKVAGSEITAGSSASRGQFSGKLHIRAPQTETFDDLQVKAINGTIVDASSIVVEGYRIYDLTSTGGQITKDVQNSVHQDAQAFLGVAGASSGHFANITSRLLANNATLADQLVLATGAEIINTTGDLVLGAANSDTTSDWDLSTFRYGPKSAAGILTLKAAGSLKFFNALSDGFSPTIASSDATWLWLARPTVQNSALPANAQSWSYRMTAGADFAATDFRQVKDVSTLAAGTGSVQLGKDGGTMYVQGDNNALTSTMIGATLDNGGKGLFQTIRTGSGDIDIHAGRSVQLLNQFATVYTAGVRVADPGLGGVFDVSTLSQAGGTGSLGAAQQNYPAYYTLAGGNINITAGLDIERLGANSSRQLPNNWLYRRGYVDSATGQFGRTGFGVAVASTSWWVDFSNFFQGVGTLGGGHVALDAGRHVTNVDAVAPTNARMPKGVPDASKLVELGGGDVSVRAGGNIDAGVYYVERGKGTLTAGGTITTNATRSPGQISALTGANAVLDRNTWLPTTLFLGKGGFDVSARGDVLLGPVANAFLMPQGVNNSFWNKTYFSTYAADSRVNVSSLGGDITLRQGAMLNNVFLPLLQIWASTQQMFSSISSGMAQPWLRLAENNIAPFNTTLGLMPGTFLATAYSGDINLAGNLTLSPAAKGTLELLTSGHVNGLRPLGLVSPSLGSVFTAWGASTIKVSDANPASIPGIASPFAYQNLVGTTQASTTRANFLEPLDKLFRESGGTLGAQAVLETKQSLHAPGILHRNDLDPLRIYAQGGDISGLTLFSPKASRVIASRDVVDVSLYLQNVSAQDVSLVASGRDIIPYNASSALRAIAISSGNLLVQTLAGLGNSPLAGDIQINGPGTLQVLAGGHLDLGSGANLANGTGAGLTSLGNVRNPFLPFEGAHIIAGAGIGAATGLTDSRLGFATFITKYVMGDKGAAYLKEVSADPNTPVTQASFALLPTEEQKRLALEIFFLVLRDAGRDHNNPNSPGFGSYDEGKAAIALLFPGENWKGDIRTQARDIRTRNGGNITLFTPGGGLTLATDLIGAPLTPPGIITDAGGNINIFTHTSVNLGISRIFTLRGGNQVIWSTTGDIAAGSSSKTVQAAPPTRVIIDPQSADVATDLAGLATGGGIGVLASVKGVPPGSVDLIAPEGTIDAGDAGIRATGNLNIAAAQILNANNISVGGVSTGAAPGAVAAPSLGSITAASSSSAAAGATTGQTVAQNRDSNASENLPSIITVEVLGYGGDEEEDERNKEGAE